MIDRIINIITIKVVISIFCWSSFSMCIYSCKSSEVLDLKLYGSKSWYLQAEEQEQCIKGIIQENLKPNGPQSRNNDLNLVTDSMTYAIYDPEKLFKPFSSGNRIELLAKIIDDPAQGIVSEIWASKVGCTP